MSTPRPGSLEYWAQERPGAVALIEGAQVLSWKMLNDEADRLAHGLRGLGLAAGDVLVTRMQTRPDWVIASAAAGKLGCRLLGLNWRLTPSESNYVLGNSGAHAIICDDEDPALLRPAFAGLNLKFAVSIARPAEGFVHYADLVKTPPAEPLYAAGNPPLILYTSGTTGQPKGVVMGSGHNLSDPVAAQVVTEYQQSVAGSRRPQTGDVVLVVLPVHHGAGPGAVWGAMGAGASMVFMRRFEPEEALRLIDRHKVNFCTAVPTIFKRIAALPPEVIARYDTRSIRNLNVGAAPVPYALCCRKPTAPPNWA
jgi:long-chain acyl-CoA synthetase